MKKSVTKLSQKSEAELQKELAQLRNEITKSKLEQIMSPQKDTNANMKKRKQIAVILTILNAKKPTVAKPARPAGRAVEGK